MAQQENQHSSKASLRIKAIVSISMLILTTGTFLSWYFLSQTKQFLMDELQKKTLSLTKNLAHNSKYGILTEDEVILKELLQGVLQEESVLFVIITDAQGRILAQQFREGQKSVFEQEVADQATTHAIAVVSNVTIPTIHYHVVGHKGVYHAAAPVETTGTLQNKSDEKLGAEMLLLGIDQKTIGRGSVQIILSLEKTQATIRKTLLTGIGLTLGTILIGVFISFAFIGYILKPVRAMARAALKIAAGDLSQRVEVDSSDEIGVLAKTFNNMTESLERKIAETKTLYEVVQEITAQVALEPTLRLIVEKARGLLQAEASLLALRQEESDAFAIQAHSGTVTEALLHVHFKAGEGLSGRVVMTGKPMLVNDYLQEYSDSPFLEAIQEASIRSAVVVPLKSRETVIGVLAVTSRFPHKFSEENQQLLSGLADHAAIAIENAKLYEQVKQYAGELEAKVELRTRELQEANRRLEEASQHKSEFLANMSHELRTPMNAIIGFTRLVMRRSKDVLQQKQYENLEKILISAEHLLELINDILDLSKVEAGRMEVQPTSFDLGQLVDHCLRTVEPLVKSDKLSLVKDVEAGCPSLFTGQDKLQQILINLLSNALKFTEEGTITITSRHRDEKIMISVADTGIGIPENKLGLIFEEFRQVDSSTTRKHSGTGLGLSISRRLAKLLGGDITAKSTVGVGSTFTVTFPRLYEAANIDTKEVAAPSYEEPIGKPEAGRIVLAIDDDPDVIYLLRENLAEAGYHVVGAVSGEEGLQKARTLRPFAIIVDIMMPHKDGWQVIHELKTDVVTRDIQIIVLSIVDNKELGYRLGVFDYLLKPFDRETVLATLARISVSHRARLLLVDDDPQMISLVRQLLEDGPYEVKVAEDGLEALETISRQRPDIILLDLLMPKMDGFAVIDQLQNDPQHCQIPIIVITAKTLTSEEYTMLEHRVSTVIQKRGLDRDTLFHELRNVLETYRSTRPKE